MSGLSKDEREWLRSAAECGAANKALLETHTSQIELMFAEQRVHADKLTVIGTKQDLCQQQNNPGNKSERNAVWVAVGGVAIALMSMLWQLVECIK